jgi:hypothetical protein
VSSLGSNLCIEDSFAWIIELAVAVVDDVVDLTVTVVEVVAESVAFTVAKATFTLLASA